MRTAHSLLRLVSILFDLAQDALQFLLLGTCSSAALKAENIFLRKQLALYLEREAKPRRATGATRARTRCTVRLPIRQQLSLEQRGRERARAVVFGFRTKVEC
jgi:hypothetical protein